MKSLKYIFSIGAIFVIGLSSCKEKIEDSSDPFSDYYHEKVNQFSEENKTLKDVDVCYLGDSLTDYFDVNKYFPNFKNANRGIAGDYVEGLEARLKVSAYDINPKAITLWIGINNYGTSALNRYENLLIGLKENLPNTKVGVVSLAPNSVGRMENVKAINPELIKLAEKYDYSYINIYDDLLDETKTTVKANYVVDGLHFSSEGYEVIASKFLPFLSEVLGV